ncbi:MAG TPA: hypothetical protein DHV12_04540 [Thermotogae bacterium]|nr:hypothetical protein [Thermotogota bacterium]
MRSIVLDRSNLFFKILERDRGQWWDHWLFYTRTFGEIFDAYRHHFKLALDKEKEFVETFTRPELDRLKQLWEEKSDSIKSKTLELLTSGAELRLPKSNFVVFFMGGLGLELVSELHIKNEHVFFVDLVAFQRREGIEQIPQVVFNKLKK